MRRRFAGAPVWLIALCVALASIEPVIHIAIEYFPPDGAVHTGLHTPDSMFFLLAMRMFETDLYSPFATCQSALGDRGLAFYPLPFHWMYGIFGAIGRFLRLPEFQYFAWINAAGFLAYCAAVYALFRVVSPKHAVRAMTIFLLGGGVGGVLFLLTGLAGWHDAPGFETNFERFARYQLFEGATLLPALQAGRLYYTLPRAFGIAALAIAIVAVRNRSWRGVAVAATALAVGTLANLNLGLMACIAALFYLVAAKDAAWPFRLKAGAVLVAAMAVPWAFSLWMVSQSPTYIEDARANAAQALWFGPLVCASLFHVTAAVPAVREGFRALPWYGRVLVGAGVGYLAAFAVLYAGFQAYWGNWLAGGDYSAAVLVSDWALIGACTGMFVAARSQGTTGADSNGPGWVLLWLLAFVCVGISAFGHGWFLRLTPTRFGWMLGPPLALIAAIGLSQMRPIIARGLYATMIVCGVASVLVSTICFIGPWGRAPGQGLFAGSHCEYMTEADAAMLAHYNGGVLLAPAAGGPYFGDVVAMRPGAKVVYGLGTYDFSDQFMTRLGPRVHRFFSADASDEERRAFVGEFCVDWVFCPDTRPIEPAAFNSLSDASWLLLVATHGRGALFAVEAPNHAETAWPLFDGSGPRGYD